MLRQTPCLVLFMFHFPVGVTGSFKNNNSKTFIVFGMVAKRDVLSAGSLPRRRQLGRAPAERLELLGLMWWVRSKRLGHVSRFSQAHEQGASSEAGQLAGSLVYCTTYCSLLAHFLVELTEAQAFSLFRQ